MRIEIYNSLDIRIASFEIDNEFKERIIDFLEEAEQESKEFKS